MKKNGKWPSLTPRHGLFKALPHCAALHAADGELTAKYAGLLSSRDGQRQTALLQALQRVEPELAGMMLIEAFNR